MTLLSKAFLDNLFPKPYEGELKTGSVRITRNGDECNFYFSNNYYEKLKTHIVNEFNQGKFHKSNASNDWIDLMNKFDDVIEVDDEVSENSKNYWLSINLEEEQKLKENIQKNNIENNETYETLVDNQGNKYETIKIGNQVWMAENYRGTLDTQNRIIETINDNNEWLNGESSKICFFNNNPSNKNDGVIYNWEAVNNLLCPKGWRVPNFEDWDILKNYLIDNKYNFDGSTEKTWGNKVAKSLASKSGWRESNSVGTPGNDSDRNNSSKFNGIPLGFRFADGRFSNTPLSASFWWSLTECDGGREPQIGGDFAISVVLFYKYKSLDYSQQVKRFGCFIRLIKD